MDIVPAPTGFTVDQNGNIIGDSGTPMTFDQASQGSYSVPSINAPVTATAPAAQASTIQASSPMILVGLVLAVGAMLFGLSIMGKDGADDGGSDDADDGDDGGDDE